MVTHNMQQAVRISDYTAFFLLGDLIEFDSTEKLFSQPSEKKNRGLYYRKVWLIMRSRFDEQLSLLNKKMIEMGTECESIINLSVKALIEGDTTCAETAKHLRGNIDHMERDIESICIKLLLQQQPVARDLRVISAALKNDY